MAKKNYSKSTTTPVTTTEGEVLEQTTEGTADIESTEEVGTEGTDSKGVDGSEGIQDETETEGGEDQDEETDGENQEETETEGVEGSDVDDIAPIFGETSADANLEKEVSQTPTITEEVEEEVPTSLVEAEPARVIKLDTVTLPSQNDDLVVGNCDIWKGSIRSFSGYKSATNIVSILMKNDKVKCIVGDKAFFEHITSKFKQVASRVSLRS